MKENFGKMKLNRNVKVKRYAPEAFEKIWNLCGVTKDHLLESMDPSKNIK